MPDATPTSTAPPSRARRNSAWVAAQIIIAATVLWFVAAALLEQWRTFRGTPLVVAPNWAFIIASGLVFLATHAILVETLRRILIAWNGDSPGAHPRLPFLTVARFWSISNFGKYVPGKLWGVGAMATMAQRAGASGVAAAGSAVLSTLVNIATGILVALVAGWRAFQHISGGIAAVSAGLALAGLVGLLALPALLPRVLEIARRVTGRSLPAASVPRRAVFIALAGNVIAWLLYGAAFQLFVYGIIPNAPGRFSEYVTAYAWPYILGYLFLVVPGGLGVREGALAAALTELAIATPPQAAVISVTSRLWLTVLELLPGLVFLAVGPRPRSKAIQ